MKTLVARPGFDQRPVHTEVLVGQQVRFACLGQDQLEEFLGDLTFQKPVPIFGEHRRHPHRLVHAQANEPSKQQVVLQLLDQHPFATD